MWQFFQVSAWWKNLQASPNCCLAPRLSRKTFFYFFILFRFALRSILNSPRFSFPSFMLRVLVIVLLLVSLSCTNEKPSPGTSPTNAFYYWQTSLGAFDWSDSLYQKM